MKKLAVIAAMLAMTMIVAAPAMAETSQDGESGEADRSFGVSSSGDRWL